MPRFREHHLALLLLVGAAALRLLPHPENTAPIGALALFAGAYLPQRSLWFIPLAALALGDVAIDRAHFTTLTAGYCAFLLIAWWGRQFLLEDDSNPRIALAIPIAAFACWFFMTLGSALASPSSGLALLGPTFWDALPLLALHLIGDGAYALMLFGIFKLTRELPFVYYSPLR